MNLYVVENGNYVEGYYLKKYNAQKAVEDNLLLIKKYQGEKGVDLKPCYITEVETED